jgi:DNA-binding response OmpR family regulator
MTGRKATILIVDDAEPVRVALAEQLEQEGDFTVLQAGNVDDGLNTAQLENAALILLDVHLPDADGRNLCQALRDNSVRAPIVLLAEVDSDADIIIRGLDSGANDYVMKPVKFRLLLARIRAHLRSFEQNEDASFQIGRFLFRPSRKLLISPQHRKIRLTDKETMILRCLCRNGATPIRRQELQREIWGQNADPKTHSLETHIYRLRQKLEPRRLLTEAGGYRLRL